MQRKLDAILDALDARNFKSALRLCNAALERIPSDHITALKAVALVKQGKHAEAHQICDALMARPLLDEAPQHFLRIVLKDLHRAADIARLCEAVCAAAPDDEAAAVQLFAAYVGEGNLIKQQQVAMRLLKASGGSEKYQWWVILSVMLQARAALQPPASAPAPPAALDPSKLLQLAESMAGRLADKAGRLASFEALLVHADLLLARAQPGAALALATGPAGAAVMPMAAEAGLLGADLAAAAGEPGRAAAALAPHLAARPDDWAALLAYLDAALPGSAGAGCAGGGQGVRRGASSLLWLQGGLARAVGEAGGSGSGGSGGGTGTEGSSGAGCAPVQAGAFAEARRVIDGLCAAAGPGGPQEGGGRPALVLRGPRLALVELAWRAAVSADQAAAGPSAAPGAAPAAAQQELAEAVMAFVRHTSHMYSCAADLRPYLPHIKHAAARTWLLEQLEQMARLPRAAPGEGQAAGPPGRGSTTADHDALRQRITALQVQAGLGAPVFEGQSEAVAHAEALMALYAGTQGLYEGVDPRERAPADELPPLAAAALVAAAAAAPTPRAAVPCLLRAVVALEAAVATRPCSAAMRLALAALHSTLGCPAAAAGHVAALDLKHVQLDTMAGHFLLPALLAYAHRTALQPHARPGAGAGGAGGAAAVAPEDAAAVLLARTRAFFDDHRREAADTLVMAYNAGAYTKVLEFVAFKERLEASHTQAVARAEHAVLRARAAAAATGQPGGAPAAVLAALQEAGGPGGADGPAAEHAPPLRFNEDLSTRPVWYPPLPGPPHLFPALWWEARDAGGVQGSGVGWWAGSASAECMHPQAVAWRRGQQRAVHGRRALAAVLAAALQAMAAAHGPHAAQHLARVRAAFGAAVAGEAPADSPHALHDRQCAAWAEELSGGAWARLPCTLQLQRLDAAALGAMLAACEAMAGAGEGGLEGGDGAAGAGASASGPQGPATQPLLQRLQLVRGAALATCGAVCGLLGAQQQQQQHGGSNCEAAALPGMALALAGALVHETLAWLACFAQAWADSLQQLRARAKKGRADQEVVAASTSGLGVLREIVKDACTQLEASLRAAAQEQQQSAAGAHAGLESSGSRLWAWQRGAGFSASAVLARVVQEQQCVMLGLADLCARWTAGLPPAL